MLRLHRQQRHSLYHLLLLMHPLQLRQMKHLHLHLIVLLVLQLLAQVPVAL